MPESTSDLWLLYANELRRLVTTGQFDPETQLITFAGTTLAFDAANADPQMAAAAIYNVGNVIPQWSASYAVQGDLATAYALFLDNIKLKGDPNPNLDSQISVAAANLTAATKNFQDVLTSAFNAWQTAQKTGMPNITFNNYVQQFYPTYTSAVTAMNAAESKYQSLLLQRYGPGFATVNDARKRVSLVGGARDVTTSNNFNMPVRTGTLAPAGSVPTLPGQTPAAAASSLATSYAPAFGMPAFAAVYQEWQTKSTNNQQDVSVSLTGDAGSVDVTTFGWSAGAEASFSYGFFRLYASGSAEGSAVNVDTTKSDFAVTFNFTGLQSFPLSPTQLWFQPSILQSYRDSLAPGGPQFFGEGGVLSLLPVQAIVGFEPQIVVKLSNESYSSLKSSFQQQANASLSIGPFRIGNASVSTYGGHDSAQWDDSSQTITIGPVKSTVPLLLGVICSKL